MNKILVLLTLATVASANFGLAGFFYFPKEFIIYNVKSLIKLETRASPAEIDLVVNDKPLKAVVHYNICNHLDVAKDCGEEFEASRAYVIGDDKKCINILPRDDTKNNLVLISAVDKEVKETDGFYINSKVSNFKVKMVCEPDAKSPLFDFSGPSLVIKTGDACGSVDQISKYIANNKVIFCLIFIVLGLVLLFFGGSKWDLILGIFGLLLGVSSVLFFFYVLVDYKANTTSFLVIAALALVIGGIVSYLTYNSASISYMIIGFPSGYFLTNLLLVLLTAGSMEDVR